MCVYHGPEYTNNFVLAVYGRRASKSQVDIQEANLCLCVILGYGEWRQSERIRYVYASKFTTFNECYQL